MLSPEAAKLFLRRLEERNVPWRDSANGLFELDWLPGLFAASECCWPLDGEHDGDRRLISTWLVVRLIGRCWNEMNGPGVRRDSMVGERRVRKLCDLAFRIFAGFALLW